MARRYAITHLPGLGADVKTYVDGEYIAPGEALPEGTQEFDLIIFMTGPNGELVNFTFVNVSVNKSVYDIAAEASDYYDVVVAGQDFGYHMGGVLVLL